MLWIWDEYSNIFLRGSRRGNVSDDEVEGWFRWSLDGERWDCATLSEWGDPDKVGVDSGGDGWLDWSVEEEFEFGCEFEFDLSWVWKLLDGDGDDLGNQLVGEEIVGRPSFWWSWLLFWCLVLIVNNENAFLCFRWGGRGGGGGGVDDEPLEVWMGLVDTLVMSGLSVDEENPIDSRTSMRTSRWVSSWIRILCERSRSTTLEPSQPIIRRRTIQVRINVDGRKSWWWGDDDVDFEFNLEMSCLMVTNPNENRNCWMIGMTTERTNDKEEESSSSLLWSWTSNSTSANFLAISSTTSKPSSFCPSPTPFSGPIPIRFSFVPVAVIKPILNLLPTYSKHNSKMESLIVDLFSGCRYREDNLSMVSYSCRREIVESEELLRNGGGTSYGGQDVGGHTNGRRRWQGWLNRVYLTCSPWGICRCDKTVLISFRMSWTQWV